jgi:putative MATE family efflux protein
MPALTSTRDYDILRLAVPALGALAAEPTYLLVDTAIVGHLGTTQLAALAIAAGFLSSAFWLFNFLAYGTTAHIARLFGAGQRHEISSVTAQAIWLALGIGLALLAVGELFAPQFVAMLQGRGEVADLATTYMRISFLGAPFVLLVLVGEGWARGVQRLGIPLKILIASNVANVILELLFVYGFDWDLAGSACGTVIAQAGAAAAFGVVLFRVVAGKWEVVRSKLRSLLTIAGDMVVRTGAILLAFEVEVALLAAHTTDGLAGTQVLDQIWIFLALLFDALAIAVQSLVGSRLGASEGGVARAYSNRVAILALTAGTLVLVLLAVGHEVIPRVFTTDEAVLAQIDRAYWLFALMQPLNAVVFAWDGVLMGAADTRFLKWAMLTAAGTCIAICAATVGAHGIVGAWIGVTAMMAIRFATNGWRIARGRWIVTGASVT